MLLNVSDKPGCDDVLGAWQSAVVDKRATASKGSDRAVKKNCGHTGRELLVEHLRGGGRSLVCVKCAVLSGQQLHRSVFSEACQKVPETSNVVFTARRWKALTG